MSIFLKHAIQSIVKTAVLYSVEVLLSVSFSLMAVVVLAIVQAVNVSIKDTDGAKISFEVAVARSRT